MPVVTYLTENECTKSTSDEELNNLLSEIREKTKKDWRINERVFTTYFFFKKSKVEKFFTLYNNTFSCEFQIINLGHHGLDTVKAYLLGYLGGLEH